MDNSEVNPEESNEENTPEEVEESKCVEPRKVPNSLPSKIRKYKKVILWGLGAATAGLIVTIVARQQIHLSTLDVVADIQGDVIDTLVDVALDAAIDAN